MINNKTLLLLLNCLQCSKSNPNIFKICENILLQGVMKIEKYFLEEVSSCLECVDPKDLYFKRVTSQVNSFTEVVHV